MDANAYANGNGNANANPDAGGSTIALCELCSGELKRIFEYCCITEWASSWQNQQTECAPSEDSDQPGYPPSLIRVFACAQWEAKDPRFLYADSEDSDQTGRMPRLIWVFAGHTVILLVLSCRSSECSYAIIAIKHDFQAQISTPPSGPSRC